MNGTNAAEALRAKGIQPTQRRAAVCCYLLALFGRMWYAGKEEYGYGISGPVKKLWRWLL